LRYIAASPPFFAGDRMDAIQESVVASLMSSLEISRTTAWSLVYEGFTTLEEVAYVPLGEMREAGLGDAEIARMRERALRLLAEQAASMPGSLAK
jgi:hypothetical protein